MHPTQGSHQNKVGQITLLGKGQGQKGVLHYCHKDSGNAGTSQEWSEAEVF